MKCAAQKNAEVVESILMKINADEDVEEKKQDLSSQLEEEIAKLVLEDDDDELDEDSISSIEGLELSGDEDDENDENDED